MSRFHLGDRVTCARGFCIGATGRIDRPVVDQSPIQHSANQERERRDAAHAKAFEAVIAGRPSKPPKAGDGA